MLFTELDGQWDKRRLLAVHPRRWLLAGSCRNLRLSKWKYVGVHLGCEALYDNRVCLDMGRKRGSR
jgi:hypothetical protein